MKTRLHLKEDRRERLEDLLERLGADQRIVLEDECGWWTPQQFIGRYASQSKHRTRGALHHGAHIYGDRLVLDADRVQSHGGPFADIAKLRFFEVDDEGRYNELDLDTQKRILTRLGALGPI